MSDEIKITHTNRGSVSGKFCDSVGVRCSIEQASDSDHVWLGRNVARMGLTRERVAELLPILQRFVETGEIEI